MTTTVSRYAIALVLGVSSSLALAQRTADVTTDRALLWMRLHAEGKFFLWVHYLDPHAPYEPPKLPWKRTNEEVFTEWELELHQEAIAAAPESERAGLSEQAARLVEEIDRYDGELRFDSTRPDGAPRKLLDVSKLTTLGWTARIGLEDGLRSTYADFVARLGARDTRA